MLIFIPGQIYIYGRIIDLFIGDHKMFFDQDLNIVCFSFDGYTSESRLSNLGRGVIASCSKEMKIK